MTLRSINSFIAAWTATLWNAMAKTGKGYRRYKLGHTGRGKDRRKDKLESGGTRLMRQYRNHYS